LASAPKWYYIGTAYTLTHFGLSVVSVSSALDSFSDDGLLGSTEAAIELGPVELIKDAELIEGLRVEVVEPEGDVEVANPNMLRLEPSCPRVKFVKLLEVCPC